MASSLSTGGVGGCHGTGERHPGGLSAGTDETVWVQTAYLIAEIIVIPLSGWLSRVFSTRWLFAASAAGFTLTSLLCGIAWNIQSMIAFRAAQGFLGGSMIPMVFTTAFAFFAGRQRVGTREVLGGGAGVAVGEQCARRGVEDGRGVSAPFEIPAFSRHCLLNGLDAVALTLQHEQEIAAFETRRP